MHVSNIILPLLTISTASARYTKRHPSAHNVPDVEKIRRQATIAMETHEGIKRTQKGKRLVRKKRSECQQPWTNSTTTAVSSASDGSATSSAIPSSTDPSASSSSSASASVIGDGNWAGNQGSSSSSAAWSESTSTSAAWSESTAEPSSTTSSAEATYTGTSDWSLVADWSGSSFFDNWNFWSYDDPTHGTVDYLGAGDAWNSGLISINSAGHAIMDVDKTNVISSSSRGRKSIRLHGNKVFTGGMVLMDAYHMPTGCGTWPAWWQNGPNWPYGGEIDILEGVNEFQQNQVSLHTGPGCTMPSNLNDNQYTTLTTGSFDSYNCDSFSTSNQGCGARDLTASNGYGDGFNSVKGGVYALIWEKAGISAYWFERSKIPSDITNDHPDPTGWGEPMAKFPSDNCDPYTYFYDHFNIFDTTFCGDWAGADGVWNYAGYAGQDQSCAAITGYSTCDAYVRNEGAKFTEAYWEIGYVKYFNSTSLV